MISKRDLEDRISELEQYVRIERKREPPKGPTLSVPIVDEDGELVVKWQRESWEISGTRRQQYKKLTFAEVCRALQDMCNIEITYQEIKGKSGVVIYEKEDD